RSPTTRAERAKLKSCKDDTIVAQGKRGTSAALGNGQKMILSPFSNLVWRAPGTPNQIGKRRAWVWGAFYPGRRPRRPCPDTLSKVIHSRAERGRQAKRSETVNNFAGMNFESNLRPQGPGSNTVPLP